MNYKEITLRLRTEHMLRGERPCVVIIPINDGKLYSPQKRKEMYIMTLYKDNKLYFHGLTRFFKYYNPEMDFKLSLESIKSYTVQDISKNIRQYTLSTNEGLYFPFLVMHDFKGSHETDVNIEKFLSKLRSMNIKEAKLNDGE